jgi:non-ribosomal peptide synthetase component F
VPIINSVPISLADFVCKSATLARDPRAVRLRVARGLRELRAARHGVVRDLAHEVAVIFHQAAAVGGERSLRVRRRRARRTRGARHHAFQLVFELREVTARLLERGVLARGLRGERGRRQEQNEDELGDVHGRERSRV